MKKKLYVFIFLATFLNIQVAYSAIDAIAIVETIIEKTTEVKTKVEEVQKKIQDVQKKLKQGFDMAKSCFKNPASCATKFAMKGVSNAIKEFPVMPGAKLMKGDLISADSEELNDEIMKTYRFSVPKKNNLEEANKYKENINNVMSGQIAILFSKGAVVRHLIKAEENDKLYPVVTPDGEGKTDDILKPNNDVLLKSAERILRINELKAYMHTPEGVATMTRSRAKAEE